MPVRARPYDATKDYVRVYEMLRETFDPEGPFANWEAMRWEYGYYHSYFDAAKTDRIGLWEDTACDTLGTRLVAVATYESVLGEAHFQLRPGYECLKPELLDHAERYLSVPVDCQGVGEQAATPACGCGEPAGEPAEARRRLRVFIPAFDPAFTAMAVERGYVRDGDWSDRYSRLDIPEPFPAIRLPEGFLVKGLDEENSLEKINVCLWHGFNHEGEPDPDLAGRARAQQAPNWRADLNIVAQAPDGCFAAYAGLWYDDKLKCAFVEPVATHPLYRRMGLGTAAVMEGVRRCAELGAKWAFVGSDQEFYKSMGFRVISQRDPWVRVF